MENREELAKKAFLVSKVTWEKKVEKEGQA